MMSENNINYPSIQKSLYILCGVLFSCVVNATVFEGSYTGTIVGIDKWPLTGGYVTSADSLSIGSETFSVGQRVEGAFSYDTSLLRTVYSGYGGTGGEGLSYTFKPNGVYSSLNVGNFKWDSSPAPLADYTYFGVYIANDVDSYSYSSKYLDEFRLSAHTDAHKNDIISSNISSVLDVRFDERLSDSLPELLSTAELPTSENVFNFPDSVLSIGPYGERFNGYTTGDGVSAGGRLAFYADSRLDIAAEINFDIDPNSLSIKVAAPPLSEEEVANMSFREDFPLGVLKIWNGSEYIPLASDEGQALFDSTKDTEVLVHGWNGIGASNTPLTEKWIAEDGGFTKALEENHRKDTNILAFDWTEAANSRGTAIKNMVAADLGISQLELSQLSSAEDLGLGSSTASKLLLRSIGRSDLAAIYDDYLAIRDAWESRLDDRWVPNEQVDRQAAALATQLAPILSQPGSGNVSFFGHSLGAGVSTKATKELIDRGLSDKVERLTLFDDPEDTFAAATSGRVLLDDTLAQIRQRSPNLAIDNYYSLLPGFGYGKAYKDAANIASTAYGHSGIPTDFYPLTIQYNTSPSTYPYSTDMPSGIGYDDRSGDLVRLRTGTDCLTGPLSVGGTANPFSGIGGCRRFGFFNVEGTPREEFRTVLGFDSHLGSENARVEIDPDTGLPTLITGSPVFAFTDDLFITEDMLGITIDFEWLNRYDTDYFRAWIDDTLIYSLDGMLARDGLLTTGLLDLSRWQNESVRLSLGVISDFGGSTLAVRDIRFTRTALTNETGTVPEPTTLALIGLGLAGIGWKRRKAA